MKQVIVFINPNKFYSILTQRPAETLGYTVRKNGIGAHLDDGKQIFYVSETGESTANKFNSDLAISSTYILIPDQFELDYGLLDESPLEFAVLYHGETPESKIIKLRSFTNFTGSKKDHEGKNTIYDKIAAQIRERKIDIEPIWGVLSSEFIMAEKAKFNSKIQRGEELDLINLPNCLSNFSKEYSEFKKDVGKTFDNSNPKHSEAFATFKNQLSRA